MRRTSVSLPKHAPASSAYDPHEKRGRYERHLPSGGQANGHHVGTEPDGWMAQTQRSRYLKVAALLTIVILGFFWFSPSGVDLYHGVSYPGHESKQSPPSSGGRNSGQAPSDSSYSTDRCTRSFSKDKPIVQYVLMIDAGSTGSRIHVYKFNNCGSTPELEHEDFKMTDKSVGGLSAFKDDPEAAARSLDPLLKVAMDAVPDKLKGCTPVAVKATAGLRMVGPELSEKILEAVRNHLETKYPFAVVGRDQNGVAIMDGSDEGVYAWITTNYLLGKIGGPDHSPTAAVFDLGGGSTQIVFEPTFPGIEHGGMPETLADGDHKYELAFGGRKFDLYQHSHLGFGLMAARKAIHAQLLSELASAAAAKGSSSDGGATASLLKETLVHPCVAPGMTKELRLELPAEHPLGAGAVNVTVRGPATPSPAQCRGLAEKILQKDAACALHPCSFNGVHQPSLAKTFAREDVFIFSYFYDRTKPLGMPDSFTLRELTDLTNAVCGGEDKWDLFAGVAGALDELRDRPEHCLDLNFMVALLHTGYEMPIDREVKIAKKIKGNELGWCLGASLPLLSQGSGWQCKITEVRR